MGRVAEVERVELSEVNGERSERRSRLTTEIAELAEGASAEASDVAKRHVSTAVNELVGSPAFGRRPAGERIPRAQAALCSSCDLRARDPLTSRPRKARPDQREAPGERAASLCPL